MAEMNGIGFGTQSPASIVSMIGLQFTGSVTRRCNAVLWISDTSLNCAYTTVSSYTYLKTLDIGIDLFLNTSQMFVSSRVKNVLYVVDQPPLVDAIIYRIYADTTISENPGSIDWSFSSLTKTSYSSSELIEIVFVVFFNNSQPYVGSDGYSIVTSRIVSPINFAVTATLVSNTPIVCAARDVPSSISIAPGAFSQLVKFSIALCSTSSSSLQGRISIMLKLEDVKNASNVSCSSPEFQLQPFQPMTLSVSKDVNATQIFIARVTLVPNVSFTIVQSQSTEGPSCQQLFVAYSASLICNGSTIFWQNATVTRSCQFTPIFPSIIPYPSTCFIQAMLPYLNSTFVRSGLIDATFGPEANLTIVGYVPSEIFAGSVIASSNGTRGACLQAQIYDSNGFLVQKSGIIGRLYASKGNIPYEFLGEISAISTATGELYWCGIRMFKLVYGLRLRFSFSLFEFTYKDTLNVISDGLVSQALLSQTLPINVSITTGAFPPQVTISLLDRGGEPFNVNYRKSVQYVRVRVLQRKSSSRRLMDSAFPGYEDETGDTCPGGGAQLVPMTVASNFTVIAPNALCSAGTSIIAYDIVEVINGTVSVISGSVPILSYAIFVLAGPAAVFSVECSNCTQISFTKLVNVIAVVFRDVGRNVPPPSPLLAQRKTTFAFFAQLIMLQRLLNV